MKARARPRVAVVIPAYQEAATIADVAARARTHADVVIVVDDGSRDGTAAALAGLDVTLLRHATNLGKGASLTDGIVRALDVGADAVITLDGDGQHEPEEIPRLLRAWRASPGDVVVGARLRRAGSAPRARRAANRCADFLVSWAAGQRIDDTQSGFRLYPAALLAALDVQRLRGGGFAFESELLIDAARAGARVHSVAIDSIYRAGARPSHFRPVSDIVRIARMLARKIVPHGLCLPGLYRLLTARPRHRRAESEDTGRVRGQ